MFQYKDRAKWKIHIEKCFNKRYPVNLEDDTVVCKHIRPDHSPEFESREKFKFHLQDVHGYVLEHDIRGKKKKREPEDNCGRSSEDTSPQTTPMKNEYHFVCLDAHNIGQKRRKRCKPSPRAPNILPEPFCSSEDEKSSRLFKDSHILDTQTTTQTPPSPIDLGYSSGIPEFSASSKEISGNTSQCLLLQSTKRYPSPIDAEEDVWEIDRIVGRISREWVYGIATYDPCCANNPRLPRILKASCLPGQYGLLS
ncbi:hypothetical protein BX600DRAFT_440117 [Xylariales sp. PMI_506]|nr:hypothetical protein BX600DRAFT_440117 [Xylariales sp. PMI_506]